MSENYLLLDVSFFPAGKIYRFQSQNLNLKMGSRVVAEEERGVDIGVVIKNPLIVEGFQEEVKEILREATGEDIARYNENRVLEEEAFKVCKEFVAEYGLSIKLLKARYMLERDKVIFYFFSETRVDFRRLIKRLAGHFMMKIEMRQVGVKDESKLLGGIGLCGRVVCCHSFLRGFAAVTMKMAKDQGLILNPIKYTGLCGRLMCCLFYENDLYLEMRRGLPQAGELMETEEGRGKVVFVNVLKRSYIVETEDGKFIEVCKRENGRTGKG